VGAQSPLDADKRNFIPVVGPWLDIGQRPCAFGGACSTSDNVGSAFLIVSGAAQGIGIILAATSFAAPDATIHLEPPSTKMMVLPMTFGAGAGVGAAGMF